MAPNGKIPDAWDDDWVAKADTPQSSTAPAPSNAKLSKAERRARQAEFNRQLWEEAEAPEGSYYLHTRDDVPLKTEFKPAVKVLSRKPAPQRETHIDPITGVEQLTVEDDDDDEDDDTKKKTLTMEERQQKAQQEREEKQRKYEEARQRLFGTDSTSTTKSGTATPKSNGESRDSSRNKASKDSRPSSSAGNKNRQLFDPSYTAKSDSVYVQKKETPTGLGRPILSEQQPIRSPRGPETSGRGGFGFAPRGGRAA